MSVDVAQIATARAQLQQRLREANTDAGTLPNGEPRAS